MTEAYPIVHDPDFVAPLVPGHRFPMTKYEAVMQVLADLGVLAQARLLKPVPAAAEDVARAHDPGYVEAVFGLAVPAAVERRIGFPLTERVLRRSRLALGGTYLAAREALRVGAASNTAGGSHHASRAGGAGFCVFNDVAYAALRLLAEDRVASVLVVDLDVHQGDGTADIFAGDPRVFTFSLHCQANYPVRKVPGDLDIGLPLRADDAAYRDALAPVLPALIARQRPDIVFFNAGVDAHGADKLGRLALRDDGLAWRDRFGAETCLAAGVPLVSVMGGGYGDDVMAIAARHARTIAILADCWAAGGWQRGQLPNATDV